jgi:hypothetical protein
MRAGMEICEFGIWFFRLIISLFPQMKEIGFDLLVLLDDDVDSRQGRSGGLGYLDRESRQLLYPF